MTTHEERRAAIHAYGLTLGVYCEGCDGDDEANADALVDMVLGSVDEDVSDAELWDVVRECAVALTMP